MRIEREKFDILARAGFSIHCLLAFKIVSVSGYLGAPLTDPLVKVVVQSLFRKGGLIKDCIFVRIVCMLGFGIWIVF